jgi:DDE superfamily endonuclease
MWCIAEITPEYRERMYRLLDLYEEKYNPDRPVICIDEKSKQLIEETRKPIPLKPGRTAKYDYEYIRHGTRNIFVAVEPKGGKRNIKVTTTRKKPDFARFVRDLVKNRYPKATEIRIVLDNLNTHFENSFYETFTKKEADAILSRVTFYYTPKHASWLNMAEIEINVMDRECLGGKIGNENLLKQQIKSWTKERNKRRKTIIWKFTKQHADKKLSKHYAP